MFRRHDLAISRRSFLLRTSRGGDRLGGSPSLFLDSAKREELLRQMGRILHEDCPVIPLYNTADVYAVRKDLVWKSRPDEQIPLVNARFQT
jgi:hypothetical protein